MTTVALVVAMVVVLLALVALVELYFVRRARRLQYGEDAHDGTWDLSEGRGALRW